MLDTPPTAEDDHCMTREQPFDLFTFIQDLTKAQTWIKMIKIFGSRRYPDNVSFGSDIDILVYAQDSASIEQLRLAIHDPYVDAFLVIAELATSVANGSQIRLGDAEATVLDAVTIWDRSNGWLADSRYRILTTLSDKSPAMSNFTAGARPVIICCALPAEYNSVVSRMPGGTQDQHWLLGSYHRWHVKTSKSRSRLVVVVQTGVASVNAAISVTQILSYFHSPELALLVGITAGLKDKELNLGDILVPTATVDVESGKQTPKGKEPAGQKLDMDRRLHKAVATVHTDCKLACTASVIAFQDQAASYREIDRKICGIEMEALGVAQACSGRVPLLVIKGISDWANEEKDDGWHRYCMDASADLAIRLISDEVI
jgi:nucleoside phosphorylase/predicted nucleotidyltransferase